MRRAPDPTRAESAVKRERLREVSVEHEVPFHDVDALRVVWHGHYFKYFELARTQLLRSCGLDEGELVGGRYQFLVVEARCRHVGKLRYGDRMRISAWFSELHRRIGIAYEVWNLTLDRRAARGHTALATLDREGTLLFEVPDEILRRIRPRAAPGP
jgi:acyl-CoA thioester hydrolase